MMNRRNIIFDFQIKKCSEICSCCHCVNNFCSRGSKFDSFARYDHLIPEKKDILDPVSLEWSLLKYDNDRRYNSTREKVFFG